jgi:hypothetical protein
MSEVKWRKKGCPILTNGRIFSTLLPKTCIVSACQERGWRKGKGKEITNGAFLFFFLDELFFLFVSSLSSFSSLIFYKSSHLLVLIFFFLFPASSLFLLLILLVNHIVLCYFGQLIYCNTQKKIRNRNSKIMT